MYTVIAQIKLMAIIC